MGEGEEEYAPIQGFIWGTLSTIIYANIKELFGWHRGSWIPSNLLI